MNPWGRSKFSPHTRGCIGLPCPCLQRRRVFPAHAGLYQPQTTAPTATRCFPRTRGVVSAVRTAPVIVIEFSPHTRGCIWNVRIAFAKVQVFPAHAGLYPADPYRNNVPTRFPRTRGVVSKEADIERAANAFSPHTRGCIAPGFYDPEAEGVFPAHAGLYRDVQAKAQKAIGFPRTRGVVSSWNRSLRRQGKFSPHTRGCIGRGWPAGLGMAVFPAYAGLYPSVFMI